MSKSWRYALYAVGITNAFVELGTTVALGIAVYVGLILWRKPMVLSELVSVLEGTSYRAAQWLGRRLPRPARAINAAGGLDPLIPPEI